MNIFIVQTSDGKRCGVGSDCIAKVFIEYNGKIPTEFEKLKKKIAKEKRDALNKSKREYLGQILAKNEVVTLLRTQSHPSRFHTTKTLADYANWVYNKGSSSLVKKILTQIKNLEGSVIK